MLLYCVSVQLPQHSKHLLRLRQAAAGADPAQQEASLRLRIAAYFEQQQEAAAEPATASAAAVDGTGAEAAVAVADADAAGSGAGNTPPTGACAAGSDGLAGLPVRATHASLALDCRELLAWARRSGLVSRYL